MFKCQLCGRQVPRSVPSRLVITKKREKIYSYQWVRAPNTERNKKRVHRSLPRSKDGGRKNGKPRFIEVEIPQHTGWEIAEEKRACPTCANRLT